MPSTIIKKIAVEGNIATGKSTFIKILEAENPSWNIISEPIAKWTNVKEDEMTPSQTSGGNLLDLFYKDPKRYAYTFESYTAMCRMKDVIKHTKNPNHNCQIQFYERSVFSSRYVFSKNSFEGGLLSETEWNMCEDWTSSMIESMNVLKVDGIIYLRANPEVSYSRMLERGRLEENSVSLEYLKSVHNKHEEWLASDKTGKDCYHGFPILVLDCNGEFKKDLSKRSSMVNDLKLWLSNL